MLWMGEIRDYNRGMRHATNSRGLEKREKRERERSAEKASLLSRPHMCY